jgi:molecular chaperone GrpE
MDETNKKQNPVTEEAVEDTTTQVVDTDEQQAAADDGKVDSSKTASTDAKDKANEALEDMQKRYMRLQADFANFKKRTTSEKQQLSEIVKIEVLQGILPVLDNFERALQAPADPMPAEHQSFLEGYTMIYKQLVAALEKEGLKKMDAVGKPFDPMFHEAVMRMASDEYENDTVIEVLQAGYLLGDKTVRPAMVKVAFNG